MNRIRLCGLAMLPLALAACGGGGDEAEVGSDTMSATTSMDTTATTAAPMPADTTMPGATGVAGAQGAPGEARTTVGEPR